MCQNYQGLRNTNFGQQKIKYLADPPRHIFSFVYIYIRYEVYCIINQLIKIRINIFDMQKSVRYSIFRLGK